MQVIAVCNQKGGAGKTTTALALWHYINAHGATCLALDLDPQGNFTVAAGRVPGKGTTARDLFNEEGADIAELLAEVDGEPPIIGASPYLYGADNMPVFQGVGRAFCLKKALATCPSSIECVVIDTAPALGILTVNAINAATVIVVPTQADLFGLTGLAQLYKSVEEVKEFCNRPELGIDGILLTKYSARANVTKSFERQIMQTAEVIGTHVYATRIRESVKVKEAQAKSRSIFDYAPTAAVTGDYEAFCQELMEGLNHDN